MACNSQLLLVGGPTVDGLDQRTWYYATGIKINLANNFLEDEGTGSGREGVSFLQLLIR